MEQAYVDKLDGKITEEFWVKKHNDWQLEERQILSKMGQPGGASAARELALHRILKLANKAYFLYLRQNHFEQGKLLRIVLSNCLIDSVSVSPTYIKPFDRIFEAVKTGGWRHTRDNFKPCHHRAL